MNSPRRPVIGITMDTRDGEGGYYQLGFDYTQSIEKAGGLPFAIPYKTDPALIPQIADHLDGRWQRTRQRRFTECVEMRGQRVTRHQPFSPQPNSSKHPNVPKNSCRVKRITLVSCFSQLS